jgi:uncharacterized protein (DUF952 family)
MTDLLYKIETAENWREAQAQGVYMGSPLDVADGFIHLSGAHQVRETAGKWFRGRTGLVLIGLDPAPLGETLVWEPSRDGALFPHIYGPLPMNAVQSVVPMPVGDDGLHLFGPDIL